MCLPDAVCSGSVEKPQGFRAGSTCALITLVSGQAFWRLSKLSVLPSAVLDPCIDLHSFALRVHHCTPCTADVVVVALLGGTGVGLGEETASHSSVRTCLNFR